MMLNKTYNDQNIIARVRTKMTENFSAQNNAKISNSQVNLNFLNNLRNSSVVQNLIAYDHIYAASAGQNNLVSTSENNCQNTESEVSFLKELLMLHLDLIQQQNEDILNKDKTIARLTQENEMVKLHV